MIVNFSGNKLLKLLNIPVVHIRGYQFSWHILLCITIIKIEEFHIFFNYAKMISTKKEKDRLCMGYLNIYHRWIVLALIFRNQALIFFLVFMENVLLQSKFSRNIFWKRRNVNLELRTAYENRIRNVNIASDSTRIFPLSKFWYWQVCSASHWTRESFPLKNSLSISDTSKALLRSFIR